MSREVVWTHPAEHDLRRLDRQALERIFRVVAQLAEAGRGDVRPLAGRSRQWRLRVGDWRVIFTYDEDTNTIEIIRVLPRGRAYRD